MPPARTLAVFAAILTLSIACGGSKTTPAETAGPTEEVPAQTAAAIPDATREASSDESEQWETLGSAYRDNCVKWGLDTSGEDLRSASVDFCQCAYAALRDHLTLEEFSEYQRLHADRDESRFDILPDAATRDAESCDAIYDSAVDWQLIEERDRLTGNALVAASNASFEHDFSSPYDQYPGFLSIECDEGRLSASVSFGGQSVFGQIRSSLVPVAYKFDNERIVNDDWNETPEFDHDWVAAPVTKRQRFIQSVQNSRTLVFRAWNYDDSEIGTITFDLTGKKFYIDSVLDECGY